ncbi:hypothetical protein B0O41_0885 [Propionibacteriaceae bacterium ES.041]|nr:hypothetical protein B0O41_0885 [Propionibacteriaceae bacterium ES.041]
MTATSQGLPFVSVGSANVTLPIYNDIASASQHWADGEASIGDVTAVADIGLGILSVALDPLNALIGAAVGSLMDILVKNVSWLKEPVDFLLGNPDAIYAHAQKWQTISDDLVGVANQHAGTAGDLPGWQGRASEAYTQVMQGVNDNYRSASAAAAKMADWVSTAGMVVGIFRETIWNLIKMFVTEVVQAAILAAAAAVPSVGASLAAFTGWFGARMAMIGAKIASKMGKLMRILSKLAKKMNRSSKFFDDAARALSKVSQKLARSARLKIAGDATRPAVRGRHSIPNDRIPMKPKMPGRTTSAEVFGEKGGEIYDRLRTVNRNVVKPMDRSQTSGTLEANDTQEEIQDIDR